MNDVPTPLQFFVFFLLPNFFCFQNQIKSYIRQSEVSIKQQPSNNINSSYNNNKFNTWWTSTCNSTTATYKWRGTETISKGFGKQVPFILSTKFKKKGHPKILDHYFFLTIQSWSASQFYFGCCFSSPILLILHFEWLFIIIKVTWQLYSHYSELSLFLDKTHFSLIFAIFAWTRTSGWYHWGQYQRQWLFWLWARNGQNTAIGKWQTISERLSFLPREIIFKGKQFQRSFHNQCLSKISTKKPCVYFVTLSKQGIIVHSCP